MSRYAGQKRGRAQVDPIGVRGNVPRHLVPQSPRQSKCAAILEVFQFPAPDS